MLNKRIAILVGHRQISGEGAVNYLGETEYSFNYRIAHKLTGKLKREMEIDGGLFYREKYESIPLIGEDIAEYDPDLCIELHFNSYHRPITGAVSEVLISKEYSNYKTIMLAKMFLDGMKNAFNFKNRGMKRIQKGDRGHINLDSILRCNKYVTCILVEPVFANFPTAEAVEFFDMEDEYVDMLFNTIKNWYHFNENEDLDAPTTERN